MIILENITNDPKQLFSIEWLDNQIDFYVRFSELTSCWLMDVKYKDFQKNGIRICNSPDLLNSSRVIAGFNIACSLIDRSEPYLIDDFVNGRAQLIVMTLDEFDELLLTL